MESNNKVLNVGVKVSYDGQMRRFPLTSTSFVALRDQIVALLELNAANIVLKYTDEEGDLITVSSDLELASAIVPGQLLRLTIIENNPVPKQVSVANPVVPAVVAVPAPATAPDQPQGPDFFKAFGRGCGGGRGGFAGRGGFGGRGGHCGRKDLSPEELEKLKEERRRAREEMRERGVFPHHGFGGRGGRWIGGWTAPNANAQESKERLVAKFMKDVTIEDGTPLVAGTPFVKTWRMKNDGAVDWPAGSVLRFLGRHSDSMGGPETVAVAGPVAPGAEVDISVSFVAPEKAGRYSGYWRMSTSDGRKFGQRVWVSIVVPSNLSSSEDDKVADKYEALVDTVLARGVNAKRHRVFRLLQKFDGDVDLVCERLAARAQRRESCMARRAGASATPTTASTTPAPVGVSARVSSTATGAVSVGSTPL